MDIKEEEEEKNVIIKSPYVRMSSPGSPAKIFEKYTQHAPFMLITTQPTSLASICLNCFSQCNWIVDHKGIRATSMTAEQSALMLWILDKQTMIEGEFRGPPENEEPIGLTFAVMELNAVLSSIINCDALCLFVNAKRTQLIVASIENEIFGIATIALQEAETSLTIPKMVYHNRTVLNEVFYMKLRSRTDSKRVRFFLSKTHFSIQLMRELGGQNCFSWPLCRDQSVTTVQGDSVSLKDQEPQHEVIPCSALLNLSIVLSLMKVFKSAKFVSVSMPECDEEGNMVHPLLFSFHVAAMGTINFFVAPMNDDEMDVSPQNSTVALSDPACIQFLCDEAV